MKMPKCNHCKRELDKDGQHMRFVDAITNKGNIWYCGNCRELLKEALNAAVVQQQNGPLPRGR